MSYLLTYYQIHFINEIIMASDKEGLSSVAVSHI